MNPKNIKERVTTYIDMDILMKIRKEAKEVGMGYQTLLNSYLRESVMNKFETVTPTAMIKKLEHDLRKLKKAIGE